MFHESDDRDAALAGPPFRTAIPGFPRISCIVCAYNEADRIQHILKAVQNHPALCEVIVVNDGSTDATSVLLNDYADIRVISYPTNRGKTYALSRGMAAARGDYLMLLDADLEGVSPADIDALARPVISGRSRVSISMRANSLSIYRRIGLDFVSGERVFPASLVANSTEIMQQLPRWGGEAYINSLIIDEQLPITVVRRSVLNIRKHAKVGLWRGLAAEMGMISDALRVLSPIGVLRQNLALLKLVARARRENAGSFGLVVHQSFPKQPSYEEENAQ